MKSKLLVYPSQEQLHEIFEYRDDNISQPLIWKIRPAYRLKIGDIAGSLYGGRYYTVSVYYIRYKLHRLVWIYHNGDVPNGMIVDHVDGNSINNRIENLRLATPSENNRNSKISSKNTSGVKGVYWYKRDKKWKAQIMVDHKFIHLGYYNTIEEAEAAIIIARNNLHGDFARHE